MGISSSIPTIQRHDSESHVPATKGLATIAPSDEGSHKSWGSGLSALDHHPSSNEFWKDADSGANVHRLFREGYPNALSPFQI